VWQVFIKIPTLFSIFLWDASEEAQEIRGAWLTVLGAAFFWTPGFHAGDSA
jgi:hypothetical protein